MAAGEGGGEQATGLGGDARRIVAEEILVDDQVPFRDIVVGTETQMLQVMPEEDREAFRGPRCGRRAERRTRRHGNDVGEVVLGDGKLCAAKPRKAGGGDSRGPDGLSPHPMTLASSVRAGHGAG